MVDAVYINFTSGGGRNYFKGGGGDDPGSCALSQALCRHRRTLAWLETTGGMARKNPFAKEGNHGGHPPVGSRVTSELAVQELKKPR